MRPDIERLQRSVDSIPRRVRQSAEDYLTEDRLSRRIRHGKSTYSAELRGYHDQYRPVARNGDDALLLSCTCDRRQMPCAHAAALLLDLERSRHGYPEAPWELALAGGGTLLTWPFDPGLPWHTVAEQIPVWRMPFDLEPWERIQKRLEWNGARTLTQDGAAKIWAELHPSWLSEDRVRAAFETWLENWLGRPSRDWREWVLLSWMQPDLPLAPVFLATDREKPVAVREILAHLFSQGHVVAPTPGRQKAMLTNLTLVETTLGDALWASLGVSDADRIARADALYLSGAHEKAAQLLERELPESPEERRAARERLVRWQSLEDSLPHRLALAWERGSTEILEPVRHLLTPSQWSSLTAAVTERSTPEP